MPSNIQYSERYSQAIKDIGEQLQDSTLIKSFGSESDALIRLVKDKKDFALMSTPMRHACINLVPRYVDLFLGIYNDRQEDMTIELFSGSPESPFHRIFCPAKQFTPALSRTFLPMNTLGTGHDIRAGNVETVNDYKNCYFVSAILDQSIRWGIPYHSTWGTEIGNEMVILGNCHGCSLTQQEESHEYCSLPLLV